MFFKTRACFLCCIITLFSHASEPLENEQKQLAELLKKTPLDSIALKNFISDSKNKDALLNTPVVDNKTPLIVAAEKEDLQAVKVILDAGADPTINDTQETLAFDNNALLVAIRAGNPELVKLLAPKSGLILNTTNSAKHTPLYLALVKYSSPFETTKKDSFKKIIQLLLDAGADPYTATLTLSPRDYAHTLQDPAIERLFYDHAKKLVLTYLKTGYLSPGFKNVITNEPVLINAPLDQHGNTLLHLAISQSKPEIAEYLVDHNAQVDTQNAQGQTPLHELIKFYNFITTTHSTNKKLRYHYEKIAQKILAKNPNLLLQNIAGDTPLAMAVITGDENLVKLIVQHNSSALTIKNKRHQTPYVIAVNYLAEAIHEDDQEMIVKYTMIVHLLKKIDAFLDIKNTSLSPLVRRELTQNKHFAQLVMNENDYLEMLLQELNAACALLARIIL